VVPCHGDPSRLLKNSLELTDMASRL